MDDDEHLARTLRQGLDHELGELTKTPTARRRLQQGVRDRGGQGARALLVATVVAVVVAVPALVARVWTTGGGSALPPGAGAPPAAAPTDGWSGPATASIARPPAGCVATDKQAGVAAELSCADVASCEPVIEAATQAGFLVGGCVPRLSARLPSPTSTPSRLQVVLGASATTGRAVTGIVAMSDDGSPSAYPSVSPTPLVGPASPTPLVGPVSPTPLAGTEPSTPQPTASGSPSASPTDGPVMVTPTATGPVFPVPTSVLVVDWGDGTATTMTVSCWAVGTPRTLAWVAHVYHAAGSFTVTARAPTDCHWQGLQSVPQTVRISSQ